MKNNTLIILIIFTVFSCKSEKETELLNRSQIVFDKSVVNITESFYDVNIDSFKIVFEKHKENDPQAALDFANRFESYSKKLIQKREEIELEENILRAARRQSEIKKNIEDNKSWELSKYGKLQKIHPDWTKDECLKVIDKKIWIGMSLEMLKYQRGIPNRANPSNYGNGTNWQWCWDDYKPSCFYGKDGIITAYN